MKKHGLDEEPSILEAVDNLSSMAELDVEEVKHDRSEGEERGIALRSSQWLDLKNEAKTVSSIKSTFKVVHNYLKHVYKEEHKQLKDKDMQKGVQSIIALANEAASKIDQCSVLFQGKTSITLSKEYRDLIEFYEKKILKRFEETVSRDDEWEDEWQGEEDAADIQRRGLKDLETVTRDRDYELFFLVKEDGSRFYNKNLIRHIRLVANFDQIISSLTTNDPLLQIKVIQDKQAQETATHLKNVLKGDLDKWIRKTGKYRDDPFTQVLYRTMMALLMASNAHNLIPNTSGKASLSYFKDFQVSLRATFNNVDYLNMIENSNEDMDPFYTQSLDLLHKLCFEFFDFCYDQSRAIAFYTRIIAKETPKKMKSARSSLSLWNVILDDHEALQNELKKFPSGPLFKVLDLLHDAPDVSFDPYLQEDIPTGLFSVHMGNKKVKVLRLACPTKQKMIHKSKVIPEFIGLMRHLKSKKKKVLFINFQDRTSWKEFARSKEIENYQKNAEMKDNFTAITLPKNSDFYLQGDTYIKEGEAASFTKMLIEQIKSGEECGFSFPQKCEKAEIHKFTEKAVVTIHKLFFGNKKQLSRKNRLDFIEIFYQLLIMKILQMTETDYLLMGSKDTVDIPSTASFSFYAFSKLLSGNSEWKEEEKDYLTSLIFLPALLIRERAVDIRHLNRAVSMLSVLSAEIELDKKKVEKAMNALFYPHFTETIDVLRP